MISRTIGKMSVVLAIAACAVAARAQSYDVSWATIDGGGGMFSVGGVFEVGGTIGQPDAGVMSGGLFTVSGGFWAGGAERPPCPGDLDGDRDVDLSDLSVLLAHFGVTGGATPGDGDTDGDGDVDLSDLSTLLARFGSVCA